MEMEQTSLCRASKGFRVFEGGVAVLPLKGVDELEETALLDSGHKLSVNLGNGKLLAWRRVRERTNRGNFEDGRRR